MTVETKTTIQLSDICSVEFECKNCHSVSSWPLGIAKSPPVKCHCGQEQWMAVGGDDFTAIVTLLKLMQRLSAANNEPYIMRFTLTASAHTHSA